MELDLCLQIVLKNTRSGLQRGGGGGEGAWRNPSSQREEGERLTGHPKEQERQSSVASHALDAFTPRNAPLDVTPTSDVGRFYRHTDIFFVNTGISLLLASANSFPDSTPGCCTPSHSF